MKSLRGVYVIEELNINVAMEAPGINGNKRRVADFCAEKVLQIGNTYSKMRWSACEKNEAVEEWKEFRYLG